ncbi:MAG: hypothetical protein PHU21_12890, partial [Elusimicrobia bacterium]|nr:hypothetical protein [Elusimicrobiota bacterium]
WQALPESPRSLTPSLRFVADRCSDEDFFGPIVPKQEWLDGNVLRVGAMVPVNCLHKIKQGDYRLLDNGILELEYSTHSPSSMAAGCVCGHQVRYEIRGLKRLPYKIQFKESVNGREQR